MHHNIYHCMRSDLAEMFVVVVQHANFIPLAFTVYELRFYQNQFFLQQVLLSGSSPNQDDFFFPVTKDPDTYLGLTSEANALKKASFLYQVTLPLMRKAARNLSTAVLETDEASLCALWSKVAFPMSFNCSVTQVLLKLCSGSTCAEVALYKEVLASLGQEG